MSEFYTLLSGPPSDTDLSDREMRVFQFLQSLGVSYQRVEHPPLADMESCRQAEKVLQTEICKNLFLCNRQQTDFYLLMMPGNKPFRTKQLSAQLGVARLSFANADCMERYLDVSPGAVSVLGLLHDTEKKVRLIIDRELLQQDFIGCHPCVNTGTLKLSMSDLMEVILPATGHTPTIVTLSEEE